MDGMNYDTRRTSALEALKQHGMVMAFDGNLLSLCTFVFSSASITHVMYGVRFRFRSCARDAK